MLIIKTLSITDEHGATLYPHVAVILVYQAPVVAQRLTFVDDYNETNSFTEFDVISCSILLDAGYTDTVTNQ